jgi:hypothetical protein
MSSLPLGYSVFEPLDNPNNNNSNSNSNRRPINRNKTRKNYQSTGSSSRVESMIAKIHENIDDKNDSDLEEFNPPPMAKSSGLERLEQREAEKNKENDEVTQEGFNEMEGNKWSQEYYQQYIPMYTNAANDHQGSTNNELLEKLNYMIHLLEEERDVKQGNVTEEVVLYCFLGVFVIFVVDSFAKVGKYVR